jgi:capsid protein
MAMSLQGRLERSRVKREIAENERRIKVLNFQNDNLKISRKRKLGATVPGTAERDMPNADRRKAMAMARQRVEESPLYQAIANARVNNIVGREFRLMMRSGDSGWDAEVENWWKLEKDRLDIRGIRTWGQLLRCWQARHDIDGDVGIALVADEFDGKPLSYVQGFEAEHICKDKNDAKDVGIEFDRYGMPITYWVTPDLEAKDAGAISFQRENFCLLMNDNTYRINRARGVSMFLQLFNLGQDYTDLLDAIVQKCKNEAYIGLKFWMQPGGDGNLFGTAQTTDTAENSVDYSQVKMLPGMNLVLGEGENVDVLESKAPHAEFDAFEKKLISRMVMPFGLSYELITGDYSGMNDRTARVQLKQFEKCIRPEQAKIGYVATKIFRWSLSRAVNAGVLTPPDTSTWFDHAWGRPGFPYINILQEAQANILLLDKGLTSRTKILGEQGDDDFDDLMDELAYEQASIAERGISIGTTGVEQLRDSTEPANAQDRTNNP